MCCPPRKEEVATNAERSVTEVEVVHQGSPLPTAGRGEMMVQYNHPN